MISFVAFRLVIVVIVVLVVVVVAVATLPAAVIKITIISFDQRLSASAHHFSSVANTLTKTGLPPLAASQYERILPSKQIKCLCLDYVQDPLTSALFFISFCFVCHS